MTVSQSQHVVGLYSLLLASPPERQASHQPHDPLFHTSSLRPLPTTTYLLHTCSTLCFTPHLAALAFYHLLPTTTYLLHTCSTLCSTPPSCGPCLLPPCLPSYPDPDYQAFVEQLEEGPRPAPTAQALLEAHEAARAAEEAKGPVVTALMAFLQQKYEAGASLGGRRGSRGPRGSGSGSGSRRDAGSRLPTVEEVSGCSGSGSSSLRCCSRLVDALVPSGEA